MNRHDAGRPAAAVGNRRIDLRGRAAAASALATGCLAVAALWKSAATSAAAGDAARR